MHLNLLKSNYKAPISIFLFIYFFFKEQFESITFLIMFFFFNSTECWSTFIITATIDPIFPSTFFH